MLGVAEAPSGAPTKRLAGGWLSDLAELGKAIVLCSDCERKWDPKNYGYVMSPLWKGQDFVTGDCDACGEKGINRHLFTKVQQE